MSSYFDSSQSFLHSFNLHLIQNVLTGEKSDAPVFSPACVIMSLALLSEIACGNTRRQILDAVGMKDAASFSGYADALWHAETACNEEEICSLSSSVWLDQKETEGCSRQRELEKQFELCHAEVFAGEMGSEPVNEALRSWLKESTGGKFQDKVSGLSLSPAIRAALYSALYFKAGWRKHFYETRRAVFHGENRQGECLIMKSRETMPYFRGEEFGAVSLGLTCLGKHLFLILPDENVSADTVLKSSSFSELVQKGEEYPARDMAEIELYLPKIQADSSLDLVPYLQEEGISDAFDAVRADFSLPADMKNSSASLFVNKIDHCTRLEWDERGVEGAAYAEVEMSTSLPYKLKNIIFRLDRPFIYLIMSGRGTILFAGAVRNL